ncbi:MAG: hypothetical protein ACP5M6_03785, partial [Methanobrevibacter sp.]
DTKYKYITARCSCGCAILVIGKFDDEDSEYYISYNKSEFYNEQDKIFSRLAKRIKHAWFTLIGKEYSLYEICMGKTDFQKLQTEIAKL